MSFIKQTFKNTASLVLAVGIIGTAYAAITTVNSGDPLTASSWNEIVTKITSTDTNSTDLVTKSYVDSSVSASSGGGGFSNCETQIISKITSASTITCSAGKSIRNHAYTCHKYGDNGDRGTNCGLTALSNTSLTGNGDANYYNSSSNGYSSFSASIICCDD